MSRNRFNATDVAARLGRIERKCNNVIREVKALRTAITPSRNEVDEVIERLHATARAMKKQSEKEREYCRRLTRD